MQENDAVEAVNTGLQGGFDIRTDLALEQRESFEGDGGEISGVKLKEWHHQKSQVKLTEVKILNDQGARAMGKPKGTYLTLEADRLSKADDEYHSEISEELAHQIRKLMSEMINWKEEDLPSVLVVGLGNRSVTPGFPGAKGTGKPAGYQASGRTVWGNLLKRQETSRHQRDSARGHGTDRDGDSGNPEGNHQ